MGQVAEKQDKLRALHVGQPREFDTLLLFLKQRSGAALNGNKQRSGAALNEKNLKTYLMAYIDIDISEFATCELIEELVNRDYTVLSKEQKDYETKSKFASSYSIDRLFDAAQLRQHLVDITDSASFASTEEILEKLKNLLNK